MVLRNWDILLDQNWSTNTQTINNVKKARQPKNTEINVYPVGSGFPCLLPRWI